MIAKDSTSYPYLAIAQHYDISYAEVLDCSYLYERMLLSPPFTEWRFKVWSIENEKREQWKKQ